MSHNIQSTSHIMMMEPVGFHSNPETHDSNSYQYPDPDDVSAVQNTALKEFREYRDKLVAEGIAVTTVLGRAVSPDDVFCNNLVTNTPETTDERRRRKRKNRERIAR